MNNNFRLGTCGIWTHGCKALQAPALDHSAKVPDSYYYKESSHQLQDQIMIC